MRRTWWTSPALTIITPVSLDHQQYPGRDAARDRRRKGRDHQARRAGASSGRRRDEGLAVIEARAARLGAPLLAYGQHWHVWEERGRLVFQDENGLLDLPLPNLPGPHQIQNAGAAIAALRALGRDEAACEAAVTRADWPARMQRLRHGPAGRDARRRSSCGWTAGTTRRAARRWRRRWPRMPARATHLICGMLNTKDVRGYMRPLAPQVTRLHAVSIPGEKNTLPAEVTRDAARAAGIDAVDGRRRWPRRWRRSPPTTPEARVLICGSLYLAGPVLRENG